MLHVKRFGIMVFFTPLSASAALILSLAPRREC
jgi:hypothetical protein